MLRNKNLLGVEARGVHYLRVRAVRDEPPYELFQTTYPDEAGWNQAIPPIIVG
jgi:hypothetical protein